MQKVFLYSHGGSGNHGCEAIVRSTSRILSDADLKLISTRSNEDLKYGLNDVCEIIDEKSKTINKISLGFLKAYLLQKFKNDYESMDKLWYKETFSRISKGDIALSIGGDNYCYSDVSRYIMLHNLAKKNGAKTVLWGCSVEPEVAARPEIAKDIAKYDLITARETITYETLKKINPNTILVADPAFCLEPKEIDLPKGFVEGNTVGINLSPMAMELEKSGGIALDNYKNLITYILSNTDMSVALIPHVVWQGGDDRLPLKLLCDEFKDSGRVLLVEDTGCCQLKYIISKCRFFIGARTHSTIAAYSSCVPTLVMGYSVKARGIAKDLFGNEEGYVVPVQSLKNKDDITNAFVNIMGKESEIKNHLKKQIPVWKEKAMEAGRVLL